MQTEETEFFPCRQIFLADKLAVDVSGIVHHEWRNFDLGIGSGQEVHVLALGEFYDEFLDKCCDVAVGDNFAFPFLDVENRSGNVDLKIVLDLELTAEAPAFAYLAPGEMDSLGRQDFAAAFEHTDLALSAAALAAACRRQEDILIG